MVSAQPVPIADLQPGDELLQSPLWARFKERFGWRAHPYRIAGTEQPITLLALSRPTPFGSLVYVPNSPPAPGGASPDAGELLSSLAARIADSLHGPGANGRQPAAPAALVRYDLPWARDAEAAARLEPSAAVRKAVVDVQPASTVLVDLRGSDDELLARMKSKTRYNVRLATRKQVRVEVAAADAAHGAPLDGWYALYRDTALRHRITAHSHAYFQVLFELAAGSESDRSEGAALFLISAHYQGELLGGIVLSTCGGGARYLYGASSPRHRKVMPNYALQWAAMQLARERGCHTYDLYGIPPAADPQHPWYGLYRLKTGFGGQVVHWCGCWDVPVRQLRYRLYRQAEALRQRYYRQLRPRLMLARR